MRASNWSTYRFAKVLALAVAAFAAGVQPAAAQSTDDVRQQLQELKVQYEKSTREFQQRIDALEAQINKQGEVSQKETKPGDPQKDASQQAPNAPTVSTAELAVEVAKKLGLGEDKIGHEYQGELSSEPSYDFLNEAESKIKKLNEKVDSFEFHGVLPLRCRVEWPGWPDGGVSGPGSEGEVSAGE